MGVLDAFRRGPRPRVAAAMPLQPGWNRTEKRLRQPWQARSEYFATVLGAARFANGISADACARCDLVVEKLEDPRGDVWEPQVDSDLLADVLRRYKGKTETQRELVRQHAWLEDTVGEAYQLIEDNGRNGLSFSMRSPLSIEWRGSSAVVKDAPGGTLRDGTAREISNEMIRRVWIPNETWPALATSPMRGVMDDCELYWTVHQKMMRDASSALIGNGILWTPSEAHTEMQRSVTEPHSQGQPGTDLERDYYAVAQRAFENGDSVEANAPLMMHWAATHGPPVKIDLAKDLDAQSIAYLTTSLEGLARGLNYPSRLLVAGAGGGVGGGGNHWCADDATEILTRDRGWVTHDALEVGDVVLTLNHEAGLSEWQPVDAVNRFDVDEELVSIETRGHSSLTTTAHRWPILRRDGSREWTTSERIGLRNNGTAKVKTANKSILLAAPSASLPSEAKYDDALVELVAWFYTEGSAEHRAGRLAARVTIHQSQAKNPHHVASIRRALTALYGPGGDLGRGGRAGPGAGNADGVPRWREIDRGRMVAFRLNAAAAEPILAVAPERIVALDFVHALTAAQLELFIETSVRADGTHMGESTRLLFQKDRAGLAAADLAAVLAGYSTSLRQETVQGFAEHEMWMLRIGARTTSRPKGHQIRRQHYAGIVWCPTTANHTWLARRDGRSFFTGNSDWLLKEDFAKEAIAPKMERIAWGDITATFLRPALRALAARGIFTDDPDLYRVGFDITPIVVHPDQSAQAMELYKLGVLADTELLDATGFDVSALPNRAELGRWIMRTQISRETIRAQQAIGDSLPSDAATVIEDTPAAPPALGPAPGAPPTVAALDVPSRVRETVLVGPMAGEEVGWLD